MIHQPWGGAQGTAMDMEIQVKEILKLRNALEEIMARHSGRSVKEVSKACERDNFMSPQEAKAFGLIDQIIEKAPDPAPKT
jgi:ATP-dependent Clp protease protease subunit